MRYFRDKLAMRMRALERGVRVPDFVPVVNHGDIRYYLEHVAGPWVLKPRQEASAIGIKKIHAADELWPILDQLGDKQSAICWRNLFRATFFTSIPSFPKTNCFREREQVRQAADERGAGRRSVHVLSRCRAASQADSALRKLIAL
jgi:hypothetical protein